MIPESPTGKAGRKRSRLNIAFIERKTMNYRANIAAVFRRACACPRALTAGALACTLSILLSTAAASAALAGPGGAHLTRVTRGATPTAVRQASARATED